MRLKELRTAVYQQVNSAVGGSVVGVFSKVPPPDSSSDASRFPYVTIGAIVATPFDTDGTNGAVALIDVNLWHRDTARMTSGDVVSSIYSAMHRADLAITGVHLIDCTFDSMNEIEQTDGITMQESLTFRVKYDEI